MLGVDLERDHAVAVASGVDRGRMLAALTQLARDRGGLVAWRTSNAVCLLPEMSAEAAADLVGATIAGGVAAPATVAAAGPASGTEGIAGAYEEAQRCHRVLLALGRVGETATAASLGVYAALFNHAGRDDLERFVQTTIGPVAAYDEERGSDLIGTLEAYFESGGNVTRTARKLHLHANTLYQRLERIRALLPRSLDDAEAALHMHLALRIRRLERELFS
jgi:DNA-binding PucR family transcriptional regulator